MKPLLPALSFFLLATLPVVGQVSFTGTYVQEFDSLSSSAGLQNWTDNATLPGWYSGKRSSSSYIVPDSYLVLNLTPGGEVGTTPGPVDYAASDGTGNRALGITASNGSTSDTLPMALGLRLRNDTGAAITTLQISYTGQQWTQGESDPADYTRLRFSYSTDASAVNTGSFVAVSALDFVAPVATKTEITSRSIALDGRQAVNQATFESVELTIEGNWAAGSDLWLRWTELFTSGRLSGLAIDDLTITVAAAPGSPHIDSQPESMNVMLGDDVQYTVIASGDAPLHYQWRKDGVDIPGASSATFEIPDVQVADAGSYNVLVWNAIGSVTSNTATLSVQGPAGSPIIVVQPEPQSTTIGGDASFSVVASGDAPLTYQWRKDGTNLDGATSSVLELHNVDTADSGSYDVRVGNSLGSVVSQAATLSVSGSPTAPEITLQPVSQEVQAGVDVSFTVAASGIPSPDFQWYKGGTEIPAATGPTLELHNVQASDADGYSVVATNAAGSERSYVATLSVGGQLGPVIYVQPSSLNAATGSTVEFRVIAIGDPDLSYIWRKDGTVIGDATGPVLTLSHVDSADMGTYDVVIANSVRTVASEGALLTVADAPTGNTLLVDQRSDATAPYKTIAAATAAAGPGDTIELAPGSGPYREAVYITTSGTDIAPIVFEGNGEEISGFQPFQFTQQTDGQWTYTLPAPLPNSLPSGYSNSFRYLITYNGVRLLADQVNGTQSNIVLTRPDVTLAADGRTLILDPQFGASPTQGWEIGGLISNGVRIAGSTAHHVYRNIRVTGMADDGFNIHGYASDIRFEDIMGYNNFDEGFSAHDVTQTSIRGGVFWGNDNGLYNQTRDTLVCDYRDILSFANLGYGYCSKAGVQVLSHVEVWDNGIQNLTIGGKAVCTDVHTYEARWTERPWVAFQESQNFTIAGKQAGSYPYLLYINDVYTRTVLASEPPTVHSIEELPPLLLAYDDWTLLSFTSAELADPAISGESADPDRDGIANMLEYAFGLNPFVPEEAELGSDASDGRLIFFYPKRLYNSDVLYTLEVSADVARWDSGSEAIETSLLPDMKLAPGIGLEEATCELPPSAALFMRLRVSQP